MVRARRQPLCSLQRWPLLLTAIFMALTVAAQSSQQTSPTNSQDAQTIDQTWQRASSKYDSERSKILNEVHRLANDGPYRADWQSLQKYEVPDLYKDAKIGMFIHCGVYSMAALRSELYPRNNHLPGSYVYKL